MQGVGLEQVTLARARASAPVGRTVQQHSRERGRKGRREDDGNGRQELSSEDPWRFG